VAGLKGSSGIYHYSPKKHALEIRSEFSAEAWNSLDLPEGAILLALSSIYWRESWKYGERAFRYCHLDIGHALAALAFAASCLGWQCKLQENVGTVDLIKLLGLSAENRDELEHPDGLMAAYPADQPTHPAVSSNQLRLLDPPGFLGHPNLLSQSHMNWPAIDDACQATTKPSTDPSYLHPSPGSNSIAPEFCKLLRQRRSAQAMDGRTSMSVANFWRILRAVCPNQIPFNILPWRAVVHILLFIHRVDGLDRGLYVLVRENTEAEKLRQAMQQKNFLWEKPPGCPDFLDLYLLEQGDARLAAKRSSCNQDIASDGCFAGAMLAAFQEPLQAYGPWFYTRMHWECGLIGQALYLGAEATSLRGCGIGCFFDDLVHDMLGQEGTQYQDLYHFAVGKALDDPRLTGLPAYEESSERG